MRGAGWSVGRAAVVVLTFAGRARADDAAAAPLAQPASAVAEPIAPPNQVDVAPAPTRPPQATAPEEYNDRHRSVDRRGVALYAGLGVGSEQRWPRVDALMPVPLEGAPHLRVGMVLTVHHEKIELPEIGAETFGLGVYPTATYDWRLPIKSSAGDFVLGVDGSLGVGYGRFKFDFPFMPGNFESVWVAVMRIAGRAEFRGHSGLLVSLQYLGIDVPLTDPDQPMQGTLTTDIAYELAILAGYQFP